MKPKFKLKFKVIVDGAAIPATIVIHTTNRLSSDAYALTLKMEGYSRHTLTKFRQEQVMCVLGILIKTTPVTRRELLSAGFSVNPLPPESLSI